MIESVFELRQGENFKDHAIVLNSLKYRESDQIVTLYGANIGKCSALARGASRSLKRFGPALSPSSHVVAHLKVPRGKNSGPLLYELSQCDLKDSFLHLRNSYSGIEASSFILRMVQDFCSEGQADLKLFQTLGRYLRESQKLNLNFANRFKKLSFWSWFSRHLGYGDFSAELSFLKKQPNLQSLWKQFILVDEINVEHLFLEVSKFFEKTINESHEVEMYQRWVESTGLQWEYCEKWLTLKI